MPHRHTEERTYRGGNVAAEAKIVVMLLVCENAWSHQKTEEARKDTPIETLEGMQSCRHLGFSLQAFRTVKE